MSQRRSRTVAVMICLLGLSAPAALCAADAPAAGAAATPSPGPAPANHRLDDAIAQRALMQERLDSAVAANHPAPEIASLRQLLMDDEDVVLELRYEVMFKTLMAASLANDLTAFRALCTPGMAAYMTPALMTPVSQSLGAAMPDGLYTARYAGSYRRGGDTSLLYVVRPVAGGNDLLVSMTVDGDRCAGMLIK